MDLPTIQEVTDLRTLEAIADTTPSENEWMTTAAVDAGDNGWVMSNDRLTTGYRLTPDGRAFVEAARTRRENPGARRRTVRRRLLDWVNRNATSTTDINLHLNGFHGSAHSWFEGDQISTGEVSDAVAYLADHGLVTTGGGFGSPTISITHKGQDCATDFDSDVAAYEAAQRPPAAGHSFTITGHGNALAVAFEPNASASASAGPVNLDAAVELAKAAREAMAVVDLGDGAEITLTDIESRDLEKGKRGLGRRRDLGADTAAGALGNLLSAAAIGLLAVL